MARKRGRNVDGILLLDKPAGITSNRALRRVSQALDARKAGHTGSLDPLATGLLVLCFGEATKVSSWLLDANKTYTATAQLGVITESADADGAVIERRELPSIDAAALEQVLAAFRGGQRQVPPMFSALKHHGKRLHELARAGVVVEREPRNIVIHRLEAEQTNPDQLTLTVACSKGTYIRSLVADIGQALGCGAHVTALRRLSLGPFDQPNMLPLESAETMATTDPMALEAQLLGADAALKDFPAVSLGADAARAFSAGQAVHTVAEGANEPVRVYADGENFMGIGWNEGEGRIQPRRLLVQRTTRG
ncbi:MAG: tRNA pseudouridine(55) synthase TruB [Spiribacter sp.]|jgi:tRNA pseudouridine55 synthase|nr:tRNA pseudouridine(55) synthase TruB [Spiribacter sp.]MDR9489579.1 tRNA pseudouridine(55) synthase TruB [Spiribacter sp.]